ncbi:MAG: hypothetical protein ACPLZD_08190 [Candidatus Saccharicenans sp.]
MGRKKKALLILTLIGQLVISSRAQLSPGQYLEEAPLGSWNIFGLESASALGAGFCQVVFAHSGTSVLTNPALLNSLPANNLTLNLGFSQTQLFRYWLVNTGVLTTSGNLSYRAARINFFNLSHRVHDWSLALSYACPENYGRPAIDYQDFSTGILSHRLKISQSGELKNYTLTLSRQLTRGLSLGLSLIWIDGQINRNLEETWPPDQVEMLDYRYQKISGFYPLIGLSGKISSRLRLGLSFIPSYHKKVQGKSSLIFRSFSDNTDIEIQDEAVDRIKMPQILAAGVSYAFKENLQIMLETVHFSWRNYSYVYFGEPRSEKFRSVIRVSLGLDYQTTFRFLHHTWNSPYYFGLMIDPQPMTDIKSTYYYVTFGSGVDWSSFSLRFATAIGIEKGSGRNLKNQKISLTLNFHPDLKTILRSRK